MFGVKEKSERRARARESHTASRVSCTAFSTSSPPCGKLTTVATRTEGVPFAANAFFAVPTNCA